MAPATVPSGMTFQDLNFKEAQISSYSLSLQHEFRGQWLASLAGAGNVVLHGTVNANGNQPRPEGGFDFNPIINTGTVSPYAFGEPFPGYGQFNEVISPTTIDWNALELNVQHPFSHGFFISGAYTWQKGFAATRDPMTTSSYGGVQDFYHPNAERGPSLTTPYHVFAFSTIWTLPWFAASKGFERALLGGWQFANVTTIQSGFPMDPKLGTPNPGLATRPDLIQGAHISGPRTKDQWFNTSAFVAPPPGFFGTAGTGSIEGPGTVSFDMSFYKDFRVTERAKFQFRSNFYNIFNHTNFANVGTTLGSGDFGQVTSARDPRIIELALRFEF